MFAYEVLAVLAPGQGAQTPGMLSPWIDLPEAGECLGAWAESIGIDLERLGSTAGADEIKDTAVTQPLVVATALLAVERLAELVGLPETAPTAGHSVGEIAAAALAGVLTPDEAVAFAAVRGRAMAEACRLEPTGMSAVLGGDPEAVLARLDELGLQPANRNGAGQVVAAGPLDALQRLAADPPERARIAPLAVAGAFHTRYMAPAQEALRTHAATVSPGEPNRPMLSNGDGAVLTDGAEVLDRLVAQVTKPVRWDLCMATLRELGVTAVLELPPAGTLVGLVKRELRGTGSTIETLALRSPDDLDAAAALMAEHAGSPR